MSKVRDELTKNHREVDEAEEGGVTCMCVTEGLWCRFFREISRASKPEKRVLLSMTQEGVRSDDAVWYDNMVVGERLSRRYQQE